MSFPFSCLVLGLIYALFHPCADALNTGTEMRRVQMAHKAASDICKGINDFSWHDTKLAADEACDQAFQALDRIKLNTCHGWRNAGCRLARRGDQYRQCTCLISKCDAYSVRSHVITPFRNCAPKLWTQELATEEVSALTTNFKKRRIHLEDDLQSAARWPAPGYSAGSNGSNGAGSSVYTTNGAGSSNWYGNPSTAYPSYATAGSYVEMARPFACDECGVRARSARVLFTHKKIYHTVCDTHCYICNTTFPHARGFEAHLRKRHPEFAADELGKDSEQAELEALLPYLCRFCGRRYSFRHGLTDHLKSHTTDDTKCRVCNKILSTVGGLKNHMLFRHPGVPLTEPGEISIQHSAQPGAQTESAAEGSEPRRFVCDQCGKSYVLKQGLRDHKQSHKGMETHCTDCNLTLSTKANYKSHLKRRHPEAAAIVAAAEKQKYIENNPIECALCKRRFKHERGLREHMDRHDGKTKCDECGAVYQRRSGLYHHKRKEHPR